MLRSKKIIRYYFGRRNRYKYLCLFSLVIILLYAFLFRLYLFRDLIYLLRPTFDQKQTFKHILPHYHYPSVDPGLLCHLHGWQNRSNDQIPRVIDAVIFSNELDLLEVRLRELWPVVDVFVVLEADRTFSGEPKQLLLEQNLKRFSWAKQKLRPHRCSELNVLPPDESPFANEGLMRSYMTNIVSRYARAGDLVVMSDVDEIPRRSTLQLLAKCTNYPSLIHLQLKTFLYSFEFFFSTDDSWRAKVQVYNPATFYYNHGRKSDYLLVDAGWHCTFCFRYIENFRFKMVSYSHNDRLMGRTYLLHPDEIQRRICTGEDIFDMYPEVYSFKEMAQKFGPIEATASFVDIPAGLVDEPERYGFLLKGNCIREDYHGDYRP